MIKLLIGTLLALTSANALAGNLTIYKDKEGRVLLTNTNTHTSLSLEEILKDESVTTETVKVRRARVNDDVNESKGSESNQTSSEMKRTTYKTTNSLGGVTKSAYLALK